MSPYSEFRLFLIRLRFVIVGRSMNDISNRLTNSWLGSFLKDQLYPLGSFGHRAGIVLSSPSRS